MEELVLKLKSGDKEEFTELFRSIKVDLYNVARTRLNNEEDIYDVIQETMISVFNNIKQIKEIKYFKTWVIKILINKCNYMHSRNRISNQIFPDNLYEISTVDEMHKINSQLDFENILKYLKYDEKLIITLFYSSRYTTKEISQILSLNENTVKTKILRAKGKIRNKGRGFYE